MAAFGVLFAGLALLPIWLVLFLPTCLFRPWRSAALMASAMAPCAVAGLGFGFVFGTLVTVSLNRSDAGLSEERALPAILAFATTCGGAGAWLGRTAFLWLRRRLG